MKGKKVTAQLEWPMLVQIEPRLAHLLTEAEAIKDDGRSRSFCANSRWYGYGGHLSFKERLTRLVGWEAQSSNPLIRTQEAYNLAYQTLYSALPDCRNCQCL